MSRAPIRFRPRSRRPRPSTHAVYLKLAFMAILLVALLAVILDPDLLHLLGLPRGGPPATAPAPAALPPRTVRIVTTSAPTTRPRPRPVPTPTRPAGPQTAPALLPMGIDRAILNDVEDLEPIETASYFEALKAVSALPEAAFAQPGLPAVTLADLVQDPLRFRGRLVAVRGTLRRLERLPLGENAAGVDHVFVAHVRDPLSVQHIYTAVLVEDPGAGIAVGREVAFTGVFFKVAVGRDGQGTLRQSPLLMGRSLRLLEAPYPEQYQVPIVLGTAVGLLLVVLMVVAMVLYRRGDRRFYRRFRMPGRRVSFDFEPERPQEPGEPDHGDDQP